MKEGQISHGEVNAAIAAAGKTIMFGRQNRLSDGVLLPDEKLPRFHAGHDDVKFLYSAVRQLPEYFLDALLARNITITLVLGKGLLVFKDVRNHQAVHGGRTRRTIYLPEKVLKVAVNNGYDYWSITQTVIVEGWKLLDYVLLRQLVEAGRQFMLKHSVSVLGWSAMRRLVQQYNRHRSAYESEELAARRDKWGVDIAISELGEFVAQYEDKLLKAMRFGGDGRMGSAIEGSFRELAPEVVAKSLYNDHIEQMWAERKAAEICEEMAFPDLFLMDRDIVHPAARDAAEAEGQDVTPLNMDEARHDYEDRMRFGIGRELATEWVVEQGIGFAPEGLKGLVEAIVDGLFVDGRPNKMLLEWTLRGLLKYVAGDDKVEVELGEENTGTAKAQHVVRDLVEEGTDLIRLRELILFNNRVRSKEQKLELDHIEMLREQMVELVSTKAKVGDMRRQMILMLRTVEELFEQLKALLIGEAKRLIGPHVTAEHVEPPNELIVWIDESVERAMLRLTLHLELMPGFHQVVERLAVRGGKVTEAVLEEFLAWAAEDPSRQMAVAAARRGLAARRGETAGEEDTDGDGLANLYGEVEKILEMLPERMHTATSSSMTSLRGAMKEFEMMRQQTPTNPKQLGLLAMVLVRLDRHEEYEALLDKVRWMGDFAVGHLAKAGLNSHYTPGLLKVIDEVGEAGVPIGTNAVELALELTHEQDLRDVISLRTISGI